jgi:hypothetical protein
MLLLRDTRRVNSLKKGRPLSGGVTGVTPKVREKQAPKPKPLFLCPSLLSLSLSLVLLMLSAVLRAQATPTRCDHPLITQSLNLISSYRKITHYRGLAGGRPHQLSSNKQVHLTQHTYTGAAKVERHLRSQIMAQLLLLPRYYCCLLSSSGSSGVAAVAVVQPPPSPPLLSALF